MFDSSCAPVPNLAHIHSHVYIDPGPHPRFQYRVISKLIVNRPPTTAIEVVLITNSVFLEIHHTPSPSTGYFTHIRGLVFPFTEVQKKSSSHHSRNTVRVLYSVLLNVNCEGMMVRTEDLTR